MKIWVCIGNALMLMFVPGYQLVKALRVGEYELATAYFMAFCAIGCVAALMYTVGRVTRDLGEQTTLCKDLLDSLELAHVVNKRLHGAMAADFRVRSIEFYNAEQQATWN